MRHKWHHLAIVCMSKTKLEVNLLQESRESSESEKSFLKVEDISSVVSCMVTDFSQRSAFLEKSQATNQDQMSAGHGRDL